MRTVLIAVAAMSWMASSGCSGELAARPAVADPSSVAADEAPFSRPPPPAADPLLAVAPPEPATPPHRAEPGDKTIYTCPMHPEVRSQQPGKCPKCGMTLVPAKERAP